MLSADTINIIKSTVPLLAENGIAITKEFYKRLFESNPNLQHIFNMANQKNGSQSSALSDVIFAYANNIDQTETLVPAVKRIANKHASLGIKPEHYPIVGENLLAAIQSVLQLPDDHVALTAWGEAYGVLAQIFIDTEEESYTNSENQQGGWRAFRSFKITNIVEETSEVKSFYFKPSDGEKIANYIGGQYIGVKFLGLNGEYDEIRQYSLSSWGDSEHYRITTKLEKDGVVSQYLHQSSVGDEVHLSAPSGLFCLNKEAEKHVFISGGVGITPLYSMLLEAMASGINKSNIQFIQCCRNSEQQIFRHDLIDICTKTDVDLKTAFESGEGADWIGYLSEAVLDEWLRDKSAHLYFCGPKPFMSALKSILNSIGFPDNQLHYEVFGPATDI